MTLFPSLLFDIYFGVRPFDWLLLLYFSLYFRNISLNRGAALTFFSLLTLCVYPNNLIFIFFGALCLLLIRFFYLNRSYITDLNNTINLFVVIFYVDFILNVLFGLDVKTLIGLKNENYEADYLRYSGILSEAANVGTVSFLLILPYAAKAKYSISLMFKYIAWAGPGILSMSITSQLFTIMWLCYAGYKFAIQKRFSLLLILPGFISLLIVVYLYIGYLDAQYLKRATVFFDILTSLSASDIADGSMSDRYAGSLEGSNYASTMKIFGTSAPSGYRSVFGILFQAINPQSVFLLFSTIIIIFFSMGLHGVYWFIGVLLMPPQFLTTAIFYVSMYGIAMRENRCIKN